VVGSAVEVVLKVHKKPPIVVATGVVEDLNIDSKAVLDAVCNVKVRLLKLARLILVWHSCSKQLVAAMCHTSRFPLQVVAVSADIAFSSWLLAHEPGTRVPTVH
jgi:hypothetical protein